MTLTDAAANPLLAVPSVPRRVAVFYRPAAGGRWRRVCTAANYSSAVARINGPGSWWLHELPADEPTGPTLFDDLGVPAGGPR